MKPRQTLTAAGFWVDDAPGWLETAFEQCARPAAVKGAAIVVEIEPLRA